MVLALAAVLVHIAVQVLFVEQELDKEHVHELVLGKVLVLLF